MRLLMISFFCLVSFTVTSNLFGKIKKHLPNQVHHQIKAYDRNHEHCKRKLSKKQQELLKHYYEKKELEQIHQDSEGNPEEFQEIIL